jgi:hypothetical protein
MYSASQSNLATDLNVERSTASKWGPGAYAIPATAFKLVCRRLDLCNSSLILAAGAWRERHERKWREHHQASIELLGVSGKSRGHHLD